jgi:Helix-turn-helix domain
MNGVDQPELIPGQRPAYVDLLNDYHNRSGLSLREVAVACDLDYSYVHYILKGMRRPQRDVIIALGFTYCMERVEVDEILLLAGYPPLGRSSLRQYRQDRIAPSPA